MLQAWWQRITGKTEDERPLIKQPLAMVMLRFYRYTHEQLRQLEARSSPNGSDLLEMDRLRRLLEPTPEPTFLQRLEQAWRGTITTSGDPVWDQWLENVRTGELPDSWWGPLKSGVKG